MVPQTPIPLYSIGQQRCFWIPGMGVFELHNAKRLCFRYPQTPFQAHSVQRYACLGRHPRTHGIFFGMVRFKHHHFRYPNTPFRAHAVQRYACLGRHPRTHTMGYLGCRCLKCTMPKNIVWVMGWPPKHAYLSAHLGPEKVFPDT